jgi:hypothetical protein
VPFQLRALELENAETLTFGSVTMLAAYVSAAPGSGEGNKTSGLVVQHVMPAGSTDRQSLLGAAEVMGAAIRKRLGASVPAVLDQIAAR